MLKNAFVAYESHTTRLKNKSSGCHFLLVQFKKEKREDLQGFFTLFDWEMQCIENFGVL